jgi:site-specific recombinase XerD
VTIKRAKTFDDKQFGRLIIFIDQHSTMPIRDRLMFLLSFKAGLRVSEIAKIDLTAMTNTEGKIAKIITIFSNVGKGKKPRVREIPMHADIAKALAAFMKSIRALRSRRSLRSRSATLRSTAAMRPRSTSGCQ